MKLLVATPLTLDDFDQFECIQGEPVYWNTACAHAGPFVTLGTITLGCECESGFEGTMSAGTVDAAIVVDEPRMTGAHYLTLIVGALMRDTGDARHAREIALALMMHANRLGAGAVVVRRRGEFRRRRPYDYLPRLVKALDAMAIASGTS